MLGEEEVSVIIKIHYKIWRFLVISAKFLTAIFPPLKSYIISIRFYLEKAEKPSDAFYSFIAQEEGRIRQACLQWWARLRIITNHAKKV